MSTRLFQGLVVQMKGAVNREIGVVDETMAVVASSDLSKIGEVHRSISGGITADDVIVNNGRTYKSLGGGSDTIYLVYVNGTDDEAAAYCKLASIAFSNAKQYFDEKNNRLSFIKNVVTDNILPGDVYARSREMHFDPDVPRVCLLVRVNNGTELSVLEYVIALFPDKTRDYVFSVNETDTVICKEVHSNTDYKDIENLATSIIDNLENEHFIKATVGIGTVVTGIRELATSLKEAQVAIEVSKVFDTDHPVISYNNLGIGRLIYQLPTTLCEMFLKEVFKRGNIESLDQETLFTIQRFFENNLNVSETSRGLFVHRNTLVYRLEKIKRLTGLDLRQFEDAIVFKVALMVRKYLDSTPTKY